MICRCCLADADYKAVNVSPACNNQKEVYLDMLSKCFNIVLSSSVESNTICGICITTLRSSMNFKKQVLQSELELLRRLEKQNDKEIVIKLEKADSGDDSDDYFLADALPTKLDIKEEKVEPVKKIVPIKGLKVKPREKKRADLKTVLNGLSKLPNLAVNATNKKDSSKLPLLLKRSTIHNTYKEKLKENIQTILKYSNVTPFKDKTILGTTCSYCDNIYTDPVDLRKHTEIDHKAERLTLKNNFDINEYNIRLDINELCCTICDEKMEDLSKLKNHLVKVHDKVFHSDVKDHILVHKLKKGEIYDCAMCSSTYETFKMLKQHMNKHYSNYTCSECEGTFATKRSLNAHKHTHLDGNFKCDLCEKIFSSRYKKHYHEKTKHFGERSIGNCPYCNEQFRSYYQRNQHLVSVHNVEAQYKCNICDKSYLLKSLLTSHIKKNHLMERNYQCSECGYRFFSKKALKAHMVKHTGEKNYSCEVCHKSYGRKYTLKEHMRIHNNDRRFKCDVCSMTFVQKCSLKSHLLSNHGITIAASEIVSM